LSIIVMSFRRTIVYTNIKVNIDINNSIVNLQDHN
jgi:hypothetical protein